MFNRKNKLWINVNESISVHCPFEFHTFFFIIRLWLYFYSQHNISAFDVFITRVRISGHYVYVNYKKPLGVFRQENQVCNSEHISWLFAFIVFFVVRFSFCSYFMLFCIFA